MTLLSVNLNKICLLRNARGRDFPHVLDFAREALDHGAGGLTVHPRPDQRHATAADVYALRALIADYPEAELNVEGRPDARFIELVLDARPQQCTLVPDDPAQLTSDHGYDLVRDGALLRPVIARLRDAGIRVAIFMDPDASSMPLARDVGADRVELYTEAYAQAHAAGEAQGVLEGYAEAARAALAAGLALNAGHDLDLQNLGLFLAAVPDVAEVSIGHALTVEALQRGWASTVAEYAQICARAPQH